MTDSVNVRELVLGILMEVTKEGAYSHLVIRSVLEKYQYLDKKERAFLTRLSEGTIQYMIELDFIINQFSNVKVNKMKPVIRNILRMGVYQLKYMDSVPDSAACNEAVKLARKKGFANLSGFVNGVLRNISRNLTQITYPDQERFPVEYFSVCYSMPEWIVKQWLADYGVVQTEKLLQAFLAEAPVTIRTNLARISPQALKQRLTEEGVKVEPLDIEKHPGLTYAFAISGFDYLSNLKSFQEGLFYVQDLSSMLVAELAAPKAEDYCIDVCAAPGGKSIHLAEKLVEASTKKSSEKLKSKELKKECLEKGMVEARDLSEYKVSLVEENIMRSQLSNIKAVQMDATVFDEASVEKADILLADLPCSGLGILRKKTDIKYKMSEKQQQELVTLQRNILDTVCAYVKRGGTLIYSTCTIHRGENEENVRWFIDNHPDFELVESRQIFPEEHLGDGFFVAKMIRAKA